MQPTKKSIRQAIEVYLIIDSYGTRINKPQNNNFQIAEVISRLLKKDEAVIDKTDVSIQDYDDDLYVDIVVTN